METLAERLTDEMRIQNVTQHQLARATGLSQPTIWKLVNGVSKTTRSGEKLAHALGLTLQWLLTGKGPRYVGGGDAPLHLGAQTREIPMLDYGEAGAAEPKRAGRESDSTVLVDQKTAKTLSKDAFAMEVQGNSVSPDLQHGDIVVVDPGAKAQPGNIVVARMDGETQAVIRKYRDRGTDKDGIKIVELAPANSDYSTITISAESPGKVVGKVIEHRRKL